MKGKHHIILETSHLKYEFDIRRNITVIRGDSATGKTTLITALRDYSRNPQNGPVRLQSDVPVLVINDDELWKDVIRRNSDSVIFIDEEHRFVNTVEFADVIKGSTNYFVLITRENLHALPYSINEIYGIRTSGKYNYPEQIYHELYPLYDTNYIKSTCRGRVLIVEDSKSGFEFYRQSCSNEVSCISADGNSNIIQVF